MSDSLSDISDSLEENSNSLEKISGKLDNINGTYAIDDVVAKMDEIETAVNIAAEEIMGKARYNLTDVCKELSDINRNLGTQR